MGFDLFIIELNLAWEEFLNNTLVVILIAIQLRTLIFQLSLKFEIESL